MRRLLYVFIGLWLGTACLIGLLMILAPYFVSRDVLKNQAQTLLSQQLKVPVTVGQVKFGWMFGLELKNLIVGAPEGFEKDLLKIAWLRMDWRLSDTFDNKISIQNLRMSKIKAAYETKHGRSNWVEFINGLSTGTSKKNTEAAKTFGSVGVKIESAELGPIDLDISTEQQSHIIRHVSLKADLSLEPKWLAGNIHINLRENKDPFYSFSDRGNNYLEKYGEALLDISFSASPGSLEKISAKLRFDTQTKVFAPNGEIISELPTDGRLVLSYSKEISQWNLSRFALQSEQRPILQANASLTDLDDLSFHVKQFSLPLSGANAFFDLLRLDTSISGLLGAQDVKIDGSISRWLNGEDPKISGVVSLTNTNVDNPQLRIGGLTTTASISAGAEQNSEHGSLVLLNAYWRDFESEGLNISSGEISSTARLQSLNPRSYIELDTQIAADHLGFAGISLDDFNIELLAKTRCELALNTLLPTTKNRPKALWIDPYCQRRPLDIEVSLRSNQGIIRRTLLNLYGLKIEAKSKFSDIQRPYEIPVKASVSLNKGVGLFLAQRLKADIDGLISLPDGVSNDELSFAADLALRARSLGTAAYQFLGARLKSHIQTYKDKRAGYGAQVNLVSKKAYWSSHNEKRYVTPLHLRASLWSNKSWSNQRLLVRRLSLGSVLSATATASRQVLFGKSQYKADANFKEIQLDLLHVLLPKPWRGAWLSSEGKADLRLRTTTHPAGVGVALDLTPKSATASFSDGWGFEGLKGRLKADLFIPYYSPEFSRFREDSLKKKTQRYYLTAKVFADRFWQLDNFELRQVTVASELNLVDGLSSRARLDVKSKQLVADKYLAGELADATFGFDLYYEPYKSLTVPRLEFGIGSLGLELTSKVGLYRGDYGVIRPDFRVQAGIDLDLVTRWMKKVLGSDSGLGFVGGQGKLAVDGIMAASSDDRYLLEGSIAVDSLSWLTGELAIVKAHGRIPWKQWVRIPKPLGLRKTRQPGLLRDDFEERLVELSERFSRYQLEVGAQDIRADAPSSADHRSLVPYQSRGSSIKADSIRFGQIELKSMKLEGMIKDGICRIDRMLADLWDGAVESDLALQITPELDVRFRGRGIFTDIDLEIPFARLQRRVPSKDGSDAYLASGTWDLAVGLQQRSLHGHAEVFRLSPELLERLLVVAGLQEQEGTFSAVGLATIFGLKPEKARVQVTNNLFSLRVYDWDRRIFGWRVDSVGSFIGDVVATPLRLLSVLSIGPSVISQVNDRFRRVSLSFIEPKLEAAAKKAKDHLAPLDGHLTPSGRLQEKE